MTTDITLRRTEVDKLLTTNRRRVVMAESDVAIGKLVLEKRADQFYTVDDSRLAMESKYPWLIDAMEDIPDDLRELDPENPLTEPAYRGIIARYELLCGRGDKISDQLFAAPQALMGAISKQADYEIKSGQMVSAASAMAMVLEIIGLAGREIENPSAKDRFRLEVTRVRRSFVDANPHLSIRSTGG